MNRDYIWIVLVAIIVGAPAGSYLMNLMITSLYPDPIPLNLAPYILTGVIIVLTVVLTISTQLRRIAEENPAVTLRAE
jgi:hypothetical protein